jgi:hypothetical protein
LRVVQQQIPKLTENDKRGYALGVELGLDAARQGMELNRELLVQGVNALTDGKFLMALDEMNATLASSRRVFHCEGAGHAEDRSACVCTTLPEEQSETV